MSLVSSPFFLSQGVTIQEGGQSLRFEDGNSAYLSFTPASNGNRQTWTFSCWFKRGNIGSATTIPTLFCVNDSATGLYNTVNIQSDDTMYLQLTDGSSAYYKQTSRVFRDTSAWYHLVWSVDTTQATATDRVKVYINGVEEINFSTNQNPTQNANTDVNSTQEHNIGKFNDYSRYWDGYLANVTLIDGQQLDPTSFGEYSDTLWRPKSDSDIQALTFGTNGFYLPFKQTTEAEGFSTVTYTGNGSIQSIEGVGFEPDLVWWKNRSISATHVLMDSVRGTNKGLYSNLTNSEDTGWSGHFFNSNGFTVDATYSGETNNSGSNFVAWAWDAGDNLAPTGFSAVTYTGNGGTQSISGLGFEPDLVWIKNRFAAYNHMLFDSVRGVGNYLESDTTDGEASGNHLISFNSDGFTVGEGSVSNRTNYSGNSYVAWAWDAGSGSPASNTDGSITSTVKANASKGFSIATYTGDGTSGSTFGHGLGVTPDLVIVKRRNTTAPWNVYTSVTGETKYLELDSNAAVATATNRWNDTAPTSSVISLGNTNNVNGSGSTYVAYSFASISGYSKVSSYTGTGTADLAVTGLGFRPAVVIIKRTDSIDRWLISDSTRTPLGDTEGTNIFLDAANAESGSSTTAMTFDNDGFTLNGTNGMINASGGTYIYIAFAGGQDLISPVNTNGTITSRVKANTAKGFSIGTVTTRSQADTIGHGLSQAPDMVIFKPRNGALSWGVYHSSFASADNYLFLEGTNSVGSSSAYWNSTAPTSTVFSIGSTWGTYDAVFYAFHSVSGYSSIGSYTGTGATGNAVTTGFEPSFVMIKRTDDTGNWHIFDNTREPNGDKALFPNLSNAESSGWYPNYIKFTSTGFEVGSGGVQTNASGGTYIYMAFADTRDATFFGDTSGNSNNWTPNALNNTDVLPDSPVTGGNFATLNPIQSLYSNSVTTFSEGNLKAALGNASNWRSAVATQQHSSGKWYYEVYANQGANGFIGFGHDNFDINGAAAYAGATAGSWGWLVSGGLYNNTASIDTLSSYTTGDIISIALDFDNAKAYWAKNGIWENSADPAAGTGGTSIDADKLYKMGFSNVSGYASTANFGQDSSFAGNETPQGNTDDNGVGDFYYAPPTGFLALTTGNIDTPAITAPDDYFNTLLWTGDGTSSRALTNVGFQPDFNWVKSRSGTQGHVLHDSVRGSDAYGLIPLTSQSTAAESAFDASWHSNFGSLDSLDSDGFTVTDGSLSGTYNTSGTTYVAWNWLASNGTVSNTDGSITSTVSANQTAGFSIVSWTDDASTSSTVGHGLNSAPELIITKNRDGAFNWFTWTTVIDGSYDYLSLNLTDTKTDDSTRALPTSSVFTNVGSISGNKQIAYCFHSVEGYSKIGSYTGNGSTDGTFIYCGFRPAFVMVKNASAIDNWHIVDNTRSTYNLVDDYLSPNLSNAESTFAFFDFTSNGFKNRSTGGHNTSGQTIIFMAFAEAPFKSANAR